MLARENRYLGQIKGDFFRQAKKTPLNCGVLYFLPQPSSVPKFAFIVSKKYFRRSSKRHQLKRQLHNFFRSRLPAWQSGIYVLVLQSPPELETEANMLKYLLKTH